MCFFHIKLAFLVLVFFLTFISGHYVPLFSRNDVENEKWINPSNKKIHQKEMLERMLLAMDLQADPCEDFYQYACGNYRKLVPQTYEQNATCQLHEVSVQSQKIVQKYLKPEMEYVRTGTERKLRDYLLSCFNANANLPSLTDLVKSYGAWPAFDDRWSERRFGWMEASHVLVPMDSPVIFKFLVEPAKRDRADIGVVSLVIEKPEIYDGDGGNVGTFGEYAEGMKSILEGIVPVAYMNNMFPPVYAFHKEMSQIAANSKEKKDANEYYLHELQGRVRGCDLGKLFSIVVGRPYEHTETIKVPHLDYVENVCSLIQRTDRKTIMDFVMIIAIPRVQGILTHATTQTEVQCKDEATAFFRPILTGMFARDYFPEESRQEVLSLTKSLQKMGAEMILSNTSWLDEQTKRRAVEKMEAVTVIIGFPDYMASEVELWKIYSSVDIDPGNYVQNYKKLNELQTRLSYQLVGKDFSAVSFDTLQMNPQFSKTGRGTLRLPVGTLLPPYYHKFSPSFIRFGSLLTILGHELMHNFDATGVENDEHGKQTQWMTPNLYLTHSYNSECFYTQFENFKLENTDVHVQGAFTLDENLADNDGIKIAFKLYKQWLAENPDKAWEEELTFTPLQMTHEQAFFLSFAQLWCDSRSLEGLITQVKSDPHAPGKFRVIAGITNSHDFAKAFNCPMNSKMNPTEKCRYFYD